MMMKKCRYISMLTLSALICLTAQAEPVLVHVNYHADKNERLAALRRRWARGGGQGDAHALDAFPDAS